LPRRPTSALGQKRKFSPRAHVVRFAPRSGHQRWPLSRPLSARSGHWPTYSITSSANGQGGVAQATLSVTVVPNGLNYIAGAPGATITSGNGKSIVDASPGGQTVLAGNGKDTIVGGPNDVLTGGNGPDTFQFGPSSGPNTIRDFNVHNDVIAFDHTLFANVTDIKAQQLGADAVITYHGTDALTLQHVAVDSLHASNFVLV
jgi:Ca2+-binding RTX toxin-like protein